MKIKAFNLKGLAIVIALLLITSVAIAGSGGRQWQKGQASRADIYLVGMGPGAADLITISAQQTVRKAHLIICDSILAKQFSTLLAGKVLLVEKPRNTIIKAVRDAVKSNKTVAILAHGDPMIYGNWLWCFDEFKDLAIKVEPGVSLFHAANAALRDDISFSDIAKSIIITTNDAPGQSDTIDKLTSKLATMVVYCRKNGFASMLDKLSATYLSDTPIALVLNGGYPNRERVFRGEISNIAKTVAGQKLPNEFIVFVGANLDGPKADPAAKAEKKNGKLYLIGLYRNSPDLATLRAMRAVEKSDLIIDQYGVINTGYKHKRLLQGKEIWAPSDKDAWIWHGYGKTADDFSGKGLERFLAAEKARQETVDKVRQAIEDGRQVCIVEFGDPLTYAPWSWVLQEFADLGIIAVPGLSSFDVANAILQKSVTQGVNTKSVILTVPDVDEWLNETCFSLDEMLDKQTSMAIFMPSYMVKLPDMITKLSSYYDRKTPIALVINAGFKDTQRVVRGRLDNIVELVGEEKLPPAHLMYVGPFLD